MTLDALIMASGAFVALLPFLGFPNSWDRVLLFCAGAVIVALGVAVRRRVPQKNTKASTFVESAPRVVPLPQEQPHEETR